MVGIRLTRGATGRESAWETDDPDDPVNQVHWLHDLLDKEYRSGRHRSLAEASRQIRAGAQAIAGIISEIERAPRAELAGELFRARAWGGEDAPDDFGPPPTQPINRFNVAGDRALYLSRSERVLAAELFQGGPVTDIWVQRFVIESGPAAVLPLDPISSAEFPRLNQLMILAERPRDTESLDPYLGTQLLRDLCLAQGIQAIEYPTVTGSYSTDKGAINLVVLTDDLISLVLGSPAGVPYRLAANEAG